MIRKRFEIALFAVALLLAMIGAFNADRHAANTWFFAAWCAALLLLFSLGLRLPLHLRGRYAQLGAGGVVVGALALGLLANIALYRHDAHFDLTAAGAYTPPQELATVAGSLDRDVAVTYFYNSQDPDALTAKDVLAVVARRARHLKVRALDLDKELVAARNYGVRIYNTAVVESEGRRTDVDNTADLRDVAFAIERVLRERTPVVCFVTGHAEPYGAGGHVHLGHTETLEGAETTLEAPQGGIERLQMAIEAIGYSDRALPLPAATAIPDDCAVVADVGPRSGYSPDEVRLLQAYLARGGRLLLLYDPEFPATPELQALLTQAGVELGAGIVLDPTNHAGADDEKVVVPYYPPHPITEQVALTVLPGPRPIRLLGKVRDLQATALITTSNDSYVRAGAASATLASAQAVAPPQAKDEAAHGPRTLAVALQGHWPEGDQREFRLVLVGSSTFASNAFFPYASNGELAVSMIRWLAGDTGRPKLKPISYSLPEVRLTHHEMQATFLVIEILLPLSVILLGVFVWRRRR
jgi:hypothetical protein